MNGAQPTETLHLSSSCVRVGAWPLDGPPFGLYPTLQMTPREIRASAYFLDDAPPKATTVQAVDAPDFPSRLKGRYVLHNATQTVNDPSVSDLARCSVSPAEAASGITLKSCRVRTDPRALARWVAAAANGSGYLVIGPSMGRYADYSGALAPGTLSALVPRLKASPYWRVWYDHDGVVIFQARPQGRAR